MSTVIFTLKVSRIEIHFVICYNLVLKAKRFLKLMARQGAVLCLILVYSGECCVWFGGCVHVFLLWNFLLCNGIAVVV
jgi:hypothetical protein